MAKKCGDKLGRLLVQIFQNLDLHLLVLSVRYKEVRSHQAFDGLVTGDAAPLLLHEALCLGLGPHTGCHAHKHRATAGVGLLSLQTLGNRHLVRRPALDAGPEAPVVLVVVEDDDLEMSAFNLSQQNV